MKISYHNPRSVTVDTGDTVSRIALAVALAALAALAVFAYRHLAVITDALFVILAALGIASGAGVAVLIHYLRHPIDAIEVGPAKSAAIRDVTFPATIHVGRQDAAISGTLRSITQAPADLAGLPGYVPAAVTPVIRKDA